VLPMLGAHIPSIVDARERLLRPGGIQIPQVDRLYMALLESEQVFREHLQNDPPDPHGVDVSAAHELIAHGWRKQRVRADQLISEPRQWATLDYRAVIDPSVRGSTTLTATRPGKVHGFTAWFATTLLPGAEFSNAPGEAEAIYGQAYFPFPAVVDVTEGDQIEAAVDAVLVGSDYVWRWSAGGTRENGEPWRIDQSTFFGTPLGPEQLRKRADRFVPRVNRKGLADAWLLTSMDASRPLRDIAHEAVERFPDVLPTYAQALARAGEISVEYSE
jgi:type I protein arginine methyltransferase